LIDLGVFDFWMTPMICEFAQEQTQTAEMLGNAAD
jgi:hypothetical protein